MKELTTLFESFGKNLTNNDMKETILSIIDLEIGEACYHAYNGRIHYDTLETTSLLIEFKYENSGGEKSMKDIHVSLIEDDPTDTVVSGEDLSDEQVIKILLQGECEEYANDMDVEI